MKVVEGFVLRPLGREFILTSETAANVNFNKMISLNQSAAYLWENIQGKDFTEEDLVRLLLDAYEVTEDVASADVASLVRKWLEAGIVEK